MRIDLLTALEGRIPHAAPWLVTVRQEQERNRLRLMRLLIKRLERSGIDGMIEHIVGAHPSRVHWVQREASHTGRWRRDLAQTVADTRSRRRRRS